MRLRSCSLWNLWSEWLKLVERIETQHGMRNDKYNLIDLDNNEVRICPKYAIKDLKPFKA